MKIRLLITSAVPVPRMTLGLRRRPIYGSGESKPRILTLSKLVTVVHLVSLQNYRPLLKRPLADELIPSWNTHDPSLAMDLQKIVVSLISCAHPNLMSFRKLFSRKKKPRAGDTGSADPTVQPLQFAPRSPESIPPTVQAQRPDGKQSE